MVRMKRHGRNACVMASFVATSLCCITMSGQQTFNGDDQPGVLRSRDGGKTWEKLGEIGIGRILSDGRGNLIASGDGIYHSKEPYTQWAKVALPGSTGGPGDSIRLVILVSEGGLIAVGAGGIFRSSDGGTTWERVSSGDIQSVLPFSGGGLIAAGGSGVFRSSDNGRTWEKISSGLPGKPSFPGFLTLANGDGSLLAGTTNGVYVSKNGGIKWVPIGLQGRDIWSLLVRPSGKIFALTAVDMSPERRVLNAVSVSVNGGRSWLPVAPRQLHSLTADLASDKAGHMYAAAFEHGFFKSIDDGRTWVKILSIPKPKNVVATYALTVTPQDEIFATAGACCPVLEVYLFRSRDGGKTWNRLLRVTNDAIDAIFVISDGTIFVSLSWVGE